MEQVRNRKNPLRHGNEGKTELVPSSKSVYGVLALEKAHAKARADFRGEGEKQGGTCPLMQRLIMTSQKTSMTRRLIKYDRNIITHVLSIRESLLCCYALRGRSPVIKLPARNLLRTVDHGLAPRLSVHSCWPRPPRPCFCYAGPQACSAMDSLAAR